MQGTNTPLTSELLAPVPVSLDETLRQAELLSSSVAAIQLSDGPGSHPKIAPIAMARLLIRNGIDALPRISCRDRNRIALQSDLLGLRALGVSSLLVDPGDAMPEGTWAKPVYDVSCPDLIAMAQAVSEEVWRDQAHEFVIGTGATVFSPEPGWTADDLVKRAAAGARFLQTQPCFDPVLLSNYMKEFVQAKLTWKFSVIVTVAPLGSVDLAHWLIENYPDVSIPDTIFERLDKAADPEQEGVEICAGLMSDFAKLPGVSGFNVLSLGNPQAVVAAIETSGLLKPHE